MKRDVEMILIKMQRLSIQAAGQDYAMINLFLIRRAAQNEIRRYVLSLIEPKT